MSLQELKERLRTNPGQTIAELGHHFILDTILVLTVKKLHPTINPAFVAQYEIANLVPNSPLHGLKQAVFHLYDEVDDCTGGYVGTAGQWLDKKIPEIEAAVRKHYRPRH